MSTENTNMNDEQNGNQSGPEPTNSTICLRKSTRERLRVLKNDVHPDATWDMLAGELADCYEEHELEADGDV